jgi:predicted nucleotidyltransferase
MTEHITGCLERCQWPALGERHDAALRAATGFVLTRFDVAGVIATGTIIRGTPDPSSDLDLYVIIRVPARQRIQRFFAGIPTEIFVNPAVAVRRYFEAEHREGRPYTAHMLATGHVIFGPDRVVDELRSEARVWLGRRSDVSSLELVRARYGAATRFEDGIDVAARDPAAAILILSRAVEQMLELHHRRLRGSVARPKDLLAGLRVLDPELAELAATFYGGGATSERITAAGRIADRTIETRGFFEWESELQPVEPDGGHVSEEE